MSCFSNLIYVLVDPFTHEIRYVGLTIKGMSRPNRHFQPAKVSNPTNHKGYWVRYVIEQGRKPIIKVVQSWETITRVELAKAEKYWIEYFITLGCPLTNSTAGGEGSIGYKHSASDKLKMSALKVGGVLSTEHRKNISATLKGNQRALGHKHDAATRKKMSERVFTQTARENMAASQRGRKHSPETKDKMARARKLWWANKKCH